MNQDQQQFVIQRHANLEGVHWDLMIQADQVLWTWRLDCSPEKILNHSVRAERILDHPLRFLIYQGPVQNGTGNVMISDSGNCTVIEEKVGELIIELSGRILNGRFKLWQETSQIWTLSLCKE